MKTVAIIIMVLLSSAQCVTDCAVEVSICKSYCRDSRCAALCDAAWSRCVSRCYQANNSKEEYHARLQCFAAPTQQGTSEEN